MKYNKDWNLKTVLRLASKFKFIRDFKLKERGAYEWALRNGYLKEIEKVLLKKVERKNNWDKKEIFKEAKKYRTKEEFKSGSRKMYERARSLGIFNEVCNHMPFHSRKEIKSNDFLIKEAKKYKRRAEMSRLDDSSYRLILKRGLAKKAFSHMKLDYDFKEKRFQNHFVKILKSKIPKSKIKQEFWLDRRSKIDVVIEIKKKVFLIELKTEKSLHLWNRKEIERQVFRYQKAAKKHLPRFKRIFIVSETGKIGMSVKGVVEILSEI